MLRADPGDAGAAARAMRVSLPPAGNVGPPTIPVRCRMGLRFGSNSDPSPKQDRFADNVIVLQGVIGILRRC